MEVKVVTDSRNKRKGSPKSIKRESFFLSLYMGILRSDRDDKSWLVKLERPSHSIEAGVLQSFLIPFLAMGPFVRL